MGWSNVGTLGNSNVAGTSWDCRDRDRKSKVESPNQMGLLIYAADQSDLFCVALALDFW